MSEWYSIEVFDGASSAAMWADAYGDALVESALSAGAKDWSWHYSTWGVVLEVEFQDAAHWEAWKALTGTQAALDAVPDPLSGLIVYRGRGGSSAAPWPRRPRPLAGSGSAALPVPWDWEADGPTLLPSAPRRLIAGSTGIGLGPGMTRATKRAVRPASR
ncbi:MAG: hypothetical protein M1435_01575 [Actinobacteria bacterium]|nr:hypothetical protein [Actinomycetota bacterium]